MEKITFKIAIPEKFEDLHNSFLAIAQAVPTKTKSTKDEILTLDDLSRELKISKNKKFGKGKWVGHCPLWYKD